MLRGTTKRHVSRSRSYQFHCRVTNVERVLSLCMSPTSKIQSMLSTYNCHRPRKTIQHTLLYDQFYLLEYKLFTRSWKHHDIQFSFIFIPYSMTYLSPVHHSCLVFSRHLRSWERWNLQFSFSCSTTTQVLTHVFSLLRSPLSSTRLHVQSIYLAWTLVRFSGRVAFFLIPSPSSVCRNSPYP